MKLKERLLLVVNAIGADVKALYAAVNGFASTAYVDSAVAAAKTELRAGAGPALDTFAEVAAQLAADESATTALAMAVANRVRYDAAQTLNAAQQLQACDNIGIGDPDFDLLAAYNTAKA